MKALHRAHVLTVSLLGALAACADVETVAPATIVVDGPSSVTLAATVALTATTADGHDTSYTWTSDSPDIADVDASGTVTGLAVGEADIRVTGDQSHAVATHPVVVIADNTTASIPNYDAWSTSPHADATAEAFTRWSSEGQVPTTCARCHSSEGYIDYLGGDGSAVGTVEAAAPSGSVIGCKTCHTSAAIALTSVTFPSGTIVDDLGPEARCMVCHQGRASGADVDTTITNAAAASDDTVSAALTFTSIHYDAAAATLEGGRTASGYQYAGKTYDTRFRHVSGFDNCTGCHDAHATTVKVDDCATCHTAVTDQASLRTIRTMSSLANDYDGDGDLSEGIADEIQGVSAHLLTAIQRYGAEHGSQPCYSSGYPYWFIDSDGSGTCETSEAVSANQFTTWTPRLVRAAYNYQFAANDLGNFAHNAKYVIELLYDSTTDLNGTLSQPIDLSSLTRTDQGHFDGTAVAARNWDTSTTGVPSTCSRCHSGSVGFRFFTQYGVGKVVPETGNGLDCSTCHETFEPDYSLYVPTLVYLADGKTTTFDPTTSDGDPGSDNVDNLCANCHIGRQNGALIEAAIAAAPSSGVSSFQNIHYDFAAATRAGSSIAVGSQYASHTYAGTLSHPGGVECTTCHDPVLSKHTFAIADVWEARCSVCHGDAGSAEEIRGASHTADYDGDSNTTESIASELDGVAAKLLLAMRAATPVGQPTICYNVDTYPYFFKDTDGSSPQCDTSEATNANAYKPWPGPLLRAAHNYQISRKDPGAFAHNFDYVDELLFDSIEALGGSTTGMTRP